MIFAIARSYFHRFPKRYSLSLSLARYTLFRHQSATKAPFEPPQPSSRKTPSFAARSACGARIQFSNCRGEAARPKPSHRENNRRHSEVTEAPGGFIKGGGGGGGGGFDSRARIIFPASRRLTAACAFLHRDCVCRRRTALRPTYVVSGAAGGEGGSGNVSETISED